VSTLRKGDALPALELRRTTVPMPALGEGTVVTVRELLRVEWRAVQNAKAAHLYRGDDGQMYYTAEGLELADITTLAFGAIDAGSGEPLWEPDAILGWASRPAVWADVRAAAQAILALSEVGADATKSGDPPPDTGG
jgi:hypothetical protein